MNKSLQEAYIILVEDDYNAQLVTLDLLRLHGANRCYSRKSVDSAISYAKKLPDVDLFLVDINMPHKSGYELLEEVRQDEALRQTKVVAITAGTFDAEIEQARERGFDGFIAKPLKAAEFANQVQRILNDESVWESR